MTRKEAINEIKSWDFLEGKEIEAIHTLIPELRESEDERIRKELIQFFVDFCGEKGDPTQDKRYEGYIAYLEKQKEQKHPDGCFTCDEYKKGYEEGRRNGFTAGYNKAIKEVEQKEQKSAEWNPNNEDVTLFNKAVTTNPNLTPSERAKLDIIRMKFKHCNGNTTKPAEVEQNPLIKMLEDKKAITEDIRNGIPTKTIEKERNVKFATPVVLESVPMENNESKCPKVMGVLTLGPRDNYLMEFPICYIPTPEQIKNMKELFGWDYYPIKEDNQ